MLVPRTVVVSVVLLLASSTASDVAAQQPELDWSCGLFVQLEGLAGTLYVRGLLDGYWNAFQLARTESKQMRTNARTAQEVVGGADSAGEALDLPISTLAAGAEYLVTSLDRGWPEGATVGEIASQLRDRCRRSGNRDRLVREVFLEVLQIR